MSVWNDLRLAVRLLVRDRSFTLMAASALALGIAATSLVFTLVNGLLLRDLPFRQPDRLVAIESRDISSGRTRNVSYLDLRDVQSSTRTLAGVAGVNQTSMNISDGLQPAERVTGAYVSANTFALLGTQPVIGRDFTAADDRSGAEPVVLIGHRLWLQRYARGNVLGRAITVNGVSSTVIGVMPERFGFPDVAEMWQPLSLVAASIRDRRDLRVVDVVARLAPDVSISQAATELDTIMTALAKQHPDTNGSIALDVLPYRDAVVGRRPAATFAALMGAVLFLLLLACANVANLFMVRASNRTRELSIRASLGASPWRIARQLLAESLVLAAGAGLVGVLAGAAATRVFVNMFAAMRPPFWLEFPLDARVLTFVALVCVGTAMIFGLVPSIQASRTSLAALNDTSKATAGIRIQRWTGASIVTQIALTIVLLAGAGLMLRSAVAQLWRDAGITTTDLVTMRIELPPQRYASPQQRGLFYQQLDDQLTAMPGMIAAIATPAPRMGGPERTVSIAGRDMPRDRLSPHVTTVATGRRYFDALGIAPRVGRAFGPPDEGRPVAIVNERFASLHFPEGGALGQRIELGPDGADIGPTGWLTIIGIVPNVRQNDEEEGPFDPVVYLPHTSGLLPNAMVVARSTLQVSAVATAVQRALQRVDPGVPLFAVARLDDALAAEGWPLRLFGSLFGVFAVSALIVAAVGLYSVTAAAVARRTRELGVRIALGARRHHVWWVVNQRVGIQLSIGLAVGLAGAFALGEVLQGVVSASGDRVPMTLAGVSILLVAVAFVACLIPAWKAMRINPVDALRAE